MDANVKSLSIYDKIKYNCCDRLEGDGNHRNPDHESNNRANSGFFLFIPLLLIAKYRSLYWNSYGRNMDRKIKKAAKKV